MLNLKFLNRRLTFFRGAPEGVRDSNLRMHLDAGLSLYGIGIAVFRWIAVVCFTDELG